MPECGNLKQPGTGFEEKTVFTELKYLVQTNKIN